jgi:hypothetical protein
LRNHECLDEYYPLPRDDAIGRMQDQVWALEAASLAKIIFAIVGEKARGRGLRL